MQLMGKTALVTGAQQGIGRGIALAFAEAGADVAINWLDDEAAAGEVATSVTGHNRRALTIQADMARLDEVREMVDVVVAEFGGIDILVNNAGVFPRVDFLTMTEADWDFVHDVNLKGAVFCAQAAAQAMVADGKPGPRYGSSEAEIAEMAAANPLGRIAQPEDIAQAALFLASEQARFITGHTLHVNGGAYLY
jgi:NAD(P)-dependent dehydrogenase (short-subunit alcohol dehydrogenase family)